MRLSRRRMLIVMVASLVCTGAYAQVDRIESGDLNGAKYKILFPKNWNHKLVIYAHGYEFPGSPSSIENPDFASRLEPILNEGFAIAASAYRGQGYVLPEGIEDSEALRRRFVLQYGQPDSTFVMGHSMGGGVTIGLVEKYGASYQGALPLCPLSSRPYIQTRKEFDLILVFNALFPGLLPPMDQIMNPSIPAPTVAEVFGKIESMKTALQKDTAAAAALASRFDLRVKDLPLTVAFGQIVLKDVAIKSGGNPYDNQNTVYTGFTDDWLVNGQVQRLPLNPSAYAFMNQYGPSGKISMPVLMMHTLYDQLIPARLAVTNYNNMVTEQGNRQWLVVKYTNGQGHCQFTADQHRQAFNTLRAWVATGKRPPSGAVE